MAITREIPKVLYKYRSLGGTESEERARIRDTIVGGTVYFPSPKDFNDPLDCRYKVDFDATPQELRKWFSGLLERNAPHRSPADRRREVLQAEKEGRFQDPVILARIERDIQRDIDSTAIYSLSAVHDSPAMWSYYADNHCGLCLCLAHVDPLFEEAITSRCAQPVAYQEDFPVVNGVKDSSGVSLNKTLLTKASDWKHEAEWRYIDTLRGPGLRRIRGKGLAGVILGARMPAKDKLEVQSWLEKSRFTLQLWQAEVSPGSYCVRVLPLT